MTHFPKSSPVSGADWFMLAMDPHMTRYKAVGNICRYTLFIDGRVNESLIRKRIAEKKIFDWLSRLKITKKGLFKIPKWEAGHENPFISFRVHERNDDEIPEEIFNQDIPLNAGTLFQIDLINRPDEKSTFIFSWHHILMDGRGAGMLLKYLNGDIEVSDPNCIVPCESKSRSFRHNWSNMMETKDFLKESSRKPVATLMNGSPDKNPEAHYHVIRFNEDETKQINENALKHGARYGLSPYYLAATCRSVNQILRNRGTSGAPFWIPVPQDERLRGASGPVITNQLSFIFYRIPVNALSSMRDAVGLITSQMVEQIKARVPGNYAKMMDWFRRMPLKPYYQLIKGPAGGSIASFLFSVAADSPTELRNFFGHRVEDAINFPPNTYPPGLTVVFMRFNGTLKIILAYVAQTISANEIHEFEKVICKDLLEGDLLS